MRIANGPIPQALGPWFTDSTAAPFGWGRRATIVLVAFCATLVWEPILYAGSWLAGLSFDVNWSIPVLLAIFVLLVLGLNMASVASSNLPGSNTDLPPAA